MTLMGCGSSGGGGFNPLSIENLGEWFDYRTLAGVGDGNPVSSWAGRKGLYTAAASGTARPTYAVNVGDGRAGLTFDGVDDALQFPLNVGDMWGPNGSYEAWFVVRNDTVGSTITTLFSQNFSVGTTINIALQPSIPRLNWSTGAIANYSLSLDLQNSAWHVIRLTKSGANWRLFVDGVEIIFEFPSLGAGTWNTGDIPAWIGGFSDFWQGGYRHFLSFKAPLDDDTAAALTSYLATA